MLSAMHKFGAHSIFVYSFLLITYACISVHGGQKVIVAVRDYKHYMIDRTSGFLRRISATVDSSVISQPDNVSSGRTMLEAVPYSLDQMLRAYGHALLDHSWNIHEIAPVVHLNMIWPGETNRPISLPCWAPAQSTRIKLQQTTLRSHQRIWYIGQGNTLSLSVASNFGYRVEPSSKALQVTPFMGLRYPHSIYTCALSSQTPLGKRASPKVSFAQTHMLYFQTNNPAVELTRSIVRATAKLEFITYAHDSDSPACQKRQQSEKGLVCPESLWMQIDPVEQNITNKGYRLYNNKRLWYNPIPGLVSLVNDTMREFCRIYSCMVTKAPNISQIENDPERNITYNFHEITEFYGEYVNTEEYFTPKRIPKLGISWRDKDLRVTHRLPGNDVLKISVEIRFSNELIDCNLVKRLIEPDMGDLQQTAHYMTLENEPAAPLSKMFKSEEMIWLRTRERTDAKKYRPTLCLTKESREYAPFGDPDYKAFMPFDGFTAIFRHIDEDSSSNYVEIGGSGMTCQLQLICHSKACRIIFTIGSNEVYEIPIHKIPNGGIYEFRQRNVPTSPKVYILVAHPVRLDKGIRRQFLNVYRNHFRITDADAEIKPMYLNQKCGGNMISNKVTNDSMIKILNWPAYELSGPSLVRATAAYDTMILPCNQSFHGIPYNASGEPQPVDIHPNNEEHIYFSVTGELCNSPCKPGYNTRYPALLYCYTAQKQVPCTKDFYIPITREAYDLGQTAVSRVYASFAMQYCNAEYSRIFDLSAIQISAQEARSCNFSGSLQSSSQVLMCHKKNRLDEMRDVLDINVCKLESKDKNFDQRLALDAVKLRMKPVLRSCKPFVDVDPLFSTYKRPNQRLYMRTYGSRKCPIGYRKKKSVDNYTCVRCPADSYADITTELNTCQGCPMTRPSTYFGDAASSAQCSNDHLNTLRGRFFRYDTGNVTEDSWESGFDIPTQQWWHRPYNKFENLEHLKPNDTYLENQNQAIKAFLALTQLTFSDTEVFLLLVISTSLAVFGGVCFMLLLAATNRPPKCPVAGYFGPEPSIKERIGLSIYCTLCKIALMLQSLWRRLSTRIKYETKRMRQSVASHRFSQAIPLAGKRISSLLRRQWEKKKLPPLTDRQKALIHLITQTTINRIVETAERDLAERRERRRIIREEQRRRRQEVGAIESEAANIEAMAAVAQREAEEAALGVADAMDSKSRMVATHVAEEAKLRADSLASRATEMRQAAMRRMNEIAEFDLEEEIIPIHKRRISIEDEHAIANAAPELRAFLRMPRYHTAAYFLLHPAMHQEASQRKTAFPAPERDYRRT